MTFWQRESWSVIVFLEEDAHWPADSVCLLLRTGTNVRVDHFLRLNWDMKIQRDQIIIGKKSKRKSQRTTTTGGDGWMLSGYGGVRTFEEHRKCCWGQSNEKNRRADSWRPSWGRGDENPMDRARALNTLKTLYPTPFRIGWRPSCWQYAPSNVQMFYFANKYLVELFLPRVFKDIKGSVISVLFRHFLPTEP